MIALIQRVLNASVTIDGEICGQIGPGLLVLLGVEQGDDEQKAKRLCERVIGYRIFGDENDKMNLNVQQAGGSLLVVSQFTLAADTQKGMRPGFSRGAARAFRQGRRTSCVAGTGSSRRQSANTTGSRHFQGARK